MFGVEKKKLKISILIHTYMIYYEAIVTTISSDIAYCIYILHVT